MGACSGGSAYVLIGCDPGERFSVQIGDFQLLAAQGEADMLAEHRCPAVGAAATGTALRKPRSALHSPPNATELLNLCTYRPIVFSGNCCCWARGRHRRRRRRLTAVGNIG